MNSRVRGTGLVVLLAVISGCATADRKLGETARVSDAEFRRDFPAAGRILSGFELDGEGADCRIGDCVLFGAELRTEGGALVRYLLATVISEPIAPDTVVRIAPAGVDRGVSSSGVVDVVSATASGGVEERTCRSWRGVAAYPAEPKKRQDLLGDTPSRLVRVESFDSDGQVLTIDFTWIPEKVLTSRLYERACEFVEACDGHEIETGEWGPAARAAGLRLCEDWLAIVLSYTQLLWDTQSLHELLDPMCVQPSLLALITNPTAKINLSITALPDLERRFTGAAGEESLPAICLPFDAKFGWEESLHCEMTAIRNRAPMQLGAGVVRISVRRMRGPLGTLTVAVLAARRASAQGAAGTPSAGGAEVGGGD